MAMTILITRKDYEALPEGAPYELHDGMLVKQPSPRYGHQALQSLILWDLMRLLGPRNVVAGPVDVLIDEITVFVPDIVVLQDIPRRDAQYVGVPLVVFEILSPSTRGRDRSFKTRRLLGLGVKEVWLVDGATSVIEVVTCDGGRLFREDEAARSAVIAGFELVPSALFAPSQD
jgi:Uma2 family endonuclease